MKSLTKLIVYLLFFTAVLINVDSEISQASIQEKSYNDKIIGIWQGVLEISGMKLRIVFNISKEEDGSLTATMDSPDQGAKDIPTSAVRIQADSLIIEASLIGGVYKGEIAEDYLSIKGDWKQSGFTLPLELERIEKAPILNRPQEPKKPYPYVEEEVIYQNEKAGIQLTGTLTLPDSSGKHPAVILISGSGAQDRDEFVFGHRPFLVLADYLTKRGIAVLRVDDRGVNGSTGDISTSTSKDFAADVLAGISFLKSRKEIDPEKIGLIGHSEGGIVAPLAAEQSKDVDFIVLMAGTGLTGEEILYRQAAMILKANGVADRTIQKNRLRQEKIFNVLKTEENDSLALEKIKEISQESAAGISDAEKKALGIMEENSDALLRGLVTPWFRFFLTYDPAEVLKQVKCPVLAINGELDLQVPSKVNLAAIEQALKIGGNTQYTVKELPQLNHLFQTAKTGSVTEYGQIEETISPSALKVIGDWIAEQTNR